VRTRLPLTVDEDVSTDAILAIIDAPNNGVVVLFIAALAEMRLNPDPQHDRALVEIAILTAMAQAAVLGVHVLLGGSVGG